MATKIVWLQQLLLILTLIQLGTEINAISVCGNLLTVQEKGSCSSSNPNKGYIQNLPQLGGAYCFNNGSGICKAFAGKFEFYFNTFTDEIIGPAPENSDKNSYVDSNGLHKRVPISYNTKGDIVYADQSINWARGYNKLIQNRKMNLMVVNNLDWCNYVENDLWPYRSSMKDYNSNGRYNIYFFNRQTCVHDKQKNKRQIFNTRFLQNSSLRTDLDANPLIFAMEDNLAQEPKIRVVKHKRQHWFEAEYKVEERENQGEGPRYFVNFEVDQKTPCKINGSGPHLFSSNSFKKFSDACVSNHYTIRPQGRKESKLVSVGCGLDMAEIVDYPSVYHKGSLKGHLIEVGLHNIPRYPLQTQQFYDVNVVSDSEWEEFARDGFTFTATTTVPVSGSNTTTTVIALFADYKVKAPKPYDEYYPEPFLSIYNVTFKEGSNAESSSWSKPDARRTNQKVMRNLNYVDDIAYLHLCGTVLIIMGPLYSELPPQNFNLEATAKIDSIYQLGIWEMVNAFFAVPDENTIWVYHRTNIMTDVKYTCAKDSDSLVTAQRSGKYYTHSGPGRPSFIKNYKIGNSDIDYTEEHFFKELGVYKGSIDINSLAAPDPMEFSSDEPAPEPSEAGSNTLVYVIVGIGILLILAMLIACLVTMRRRKKRRHEDKNLSTLHSSDSPSARSGLSNMSKSRLTSQATARSAFAPKGSSTSRTGASMRSGISKSPSSAHSKTTRSPGLSHSSSHASMGKASTNRSHLTASSPSSSKRSAAHSSPSAKPSSMSGGHSSSAGKHARSGTKRSVISKK